MKGEKVIRFIHFVFDNVTRAFLNILKPDFNLRWPVSCICGLTNKG